MAVTAVPEAVAAFSWSEEVKHFAAELPEAFSRSPGSVTDQFLQSGERQLDRGVQRGARSGSHDGSDVSGG